MTLPDSMIMITPTVATYERINDGSQKGKEKLADSEGLHLYYQGTEG